LYLSTLLHWERPMDGCTYRIFGLFQWRSIITRYFKAISIQDSGSDMNFFSSSPLFPAFREGVLTTGSNFHSEIKTDAGRNIPKHVDFVKPQTYTRCLSISDSSVQNYHTELIKTYRSDECSKTVLSHYPPWTLVNPYTQHSAFSSSRIKRRHTIKK